MRRTVIGILAALALPGVGCGVGYDDPEGWSQVEVSATEHTVTVHTQAGSTTWALSGAHGPAVDPSPLAAGNTGLFLGAALTGAAVNPDVALPQDPEPWHGGGPSTDPNAPPESFGNPGPQGPGPK